MMHIWPLKFFVTSECRYERYIFALEEASRDVLASLKDKSLKVCLALCCVLCYSWVKIILSSMCTKTLMIIIYMFVLL